MISVKKNNVTEKKNQIETVKDENKHIEFVLNSVKMDFEKI